MQIAISAPTASPTTPALNAVDLKVVDSLQTAYWAVTRGASVTERVAGETSPASLNKLAGWAAGFGGAARSALDGARNLYSLGSTRRPEITSIVAHVDEAAALVQSAVARNGHAYAPLLTRANSHFESARTALADLLLAEFGHVAY